MRTSRRVWNRAAMLCAVVITLSVLSRADNCFPISITTAQIGTAASKTLISETSQEDCVKITVTDRTFTAGVPVTYLMSDPSDGNFTSDIMFFSNDANGHETFCFESDRDPGHGQGCDIAGPTIDKRTEDLDVKFASADITFYAFLVSDPIQQNGSDYVGLSLTPLPEPGTLLLLGTGIFALGSTLRAKLRL